MTIGYSYVWEFLVCADLQAEFEKYYNTQGTWVQLFQKASGYIETLLLKDLSLPKRYLTVDRWENKESYVAFRSNFSQEYSQLDQLCEGLTESERALGEFNE